MIRAETRIQEALLKGGFLTPIVVRGRGGYVSLLCRQVPGMDKAWLVALKMLLVQTESLGIGDNVFIGRKYVLKEGQLAFGWYLQFDFKNVGLLNEAFDKLEPLFKASQPPQVVQRKTVTVKPVTVNPNIPRITIVRSGVDDDGNVVEESIMPLPHIKKDMNVPSKPIWSEEHGRMVGGGRGASGFHEEKRRR